VLIKWWLLAIPHWIIVGIFTGGIFGWGWNKWKLQPPGLIPVLAFFSGIYLLFTGKYPEALFKLVMGMQRWTFRVVGYAALMTDKYPPFNFGE
jgi:hypothetical protein